MAYNYYPNYQFYPQQYQQQQTPAIIYVQGEAGAKAYLVAPNTTVLLMDSEAQKFYIKSSDASGMPMPLRVFEYSEITANLPQIQTKNDKKIDYTSFVTKREFEAFKAEIQPYMERGTDE